MLAVGLAASECGDEGGVCGAGAVRAGAAILVSGCTPLNFFSPLLKAVEEVELGVV